MTSSKQKKRPLTDKQQRFIREYLIDLNATQAAIRSGYAAKTANRIASRMLGQPNIQEAISKLRSKLSEKLEVSAERVIEEHASIGLHNISDYYRADGTAKQLDELTRQQLAAVKGFKKAVIPADEDAGTEERVIVTDYFFHKKEKPLEALSKHLGLFEKDNEQKGTADLKSRQEFMHDLLTAIDGKSLGLPGQKKGGE